MTSLLSVTSIAQFYQKIMCMHTIYQCTALCRKNSKFNTGKKQNLLESLLTPVTIDFFYIICLLTGTGFTPHPFGKLNRKMHMGTGYTPMCVWYQINLFQFDSIMNVVDSIIVHPWRHFGHASNYASKFPADIDYNFHFLNSQFKSNTVGDKIQ